MTYDNWKTTNPDDAEIGSARQRAACQCGDEIDEDDGHLVESFETTGKILCVSCWDDICEAEFRKSPFPLAAGSAT